MVVLTWLDTNQRCRFVASSTPCFHTSLLYKLCWLQIIPKIQYKICCLLYQLIYCPNQPCYLSDLLVQCVAPSSSKPLPLLPPRACNESPSSAKCFSFFVLRLHNSLPSHIVSLPSFSSFSSSLYTHYFYLRERVMFYPLCIYLCVCESNNSKCSRPNSMKIGGLIGNDLRTNRLDFERDRVKGPGQGCEKVKKSSTEFPEVWWDDRKWPENQ